MKLDYGLAGKKALVCGSSAGIGRGCAQALADAGAHVVLNARSADRLAAAAAQIGAGAEGRVEWVVGDVTNAAERAAILTAHPDIDILVNNSAGPPMGDFRGFDEAAWVAALEAGMITPIMMIRGTSEGMIARRWGRLINITSSAVKAALPLLSLSNGARSGLTGFVSGLAREVAMHGVTINNLLPGRIDTERLASVIGKVGETQGLSYEEAARKAAAGNPTRRFGTAEEIGAYCAFLASRQAAYVTGQNLLVDGGEYPGL